MSTNLTPQEFAFNEHPIRTVQIDGKPWLVAIDVLRTLGHSTKPEQGAAPYLKALDADEKQTAKLNTLESSKGKRRGNPTLALISESGFYKLTMRAQRKNPQARAFQDWVTKTVLPAIRKDGAYVMGEEKLASGEMSEDEFVLKAMTIMQRKIERLTSERRGEGSHSVNPHNRRSYSG